MLRKFTLLFLLSVCLHTIGRSQVLDSVHIYIPYGTDTSCPGIQLTFTAVQSNDTFSNVQYHWYTDNTFIGVIIDTFYTTALVTGDSVYCELVYTNSLGVLDSAMSNVLYVYRSDSIPPRVLISLTTGSNPGCGATPLTFTAYPVNGGTSPTFQWMVDDTLLTGEDSITITRYFNPGDTVSCLMVSNSACAQPSDSAFSWKIPVIHDSLTAFDSIFVKHNPICFGTPDTFTANVYAPGTSGYSIAWYINLATIPSAVGPMFTTDSLHDGDKVYCILTDPDPCVTNKTTVSNVIIMTVIPLQDPSVNIVMTAGSNPGCLDSPVTFTATYLNSGIAPIEEWYVNGIVAATNTLTFTSTYANGDLLSFQITPVSGCYNVDSLMSTAFLMIRDSTPVAPLVSLIGNLLVANTAGVYTWYYNGVIVAGATGQEYHPPASALGYYYAVRDSANCPSLPSNVIYISLLEVNSVVNSSAIKVYPNPTTGILNLDWGTVEESMKIDIYNVYGQGMLHEEIENQSHHETDLSYLPDGNYFVVLKDKTGSAYTYKILINK